MKRTGWIRRMAAVVLVLSLFLSDGYNAAAENTGAPATQAATDTVAGTDETVTQDNDNGYWFYQSKAQGVRIEITRHEDTENTILWYEADLQFSEQSPLQFLTSNTEKPGKGFSYPEKLARDNGAVFAINDDQFGYRLYNRKKSGVIIRNGKILYEKTSENGNLGWPTLDTAAFFADGTMRVYQSAELTAQQYLDLGAQTVLSFGPWLVRDGEKNPLLKKDFTTREPRSAIGMISPRHYIVLSVEGREKASRGVGVEWLAERMQALGATEAQNLDGGKTCCILFMGKKLDTTNPKGIVKSGRSVSGLIALGKSAQVPAYAGLEK